MRNNNGPSVEITAKLILIGCLVGIGGGAGEASIGAMAAAEESPQFAGMQKGTIESSAERSLRINRDEFGIAETLEITDQYGRPIHLKNLEIGQEVYFRVDHKNQVNKVIVLIPS